MTKPSSVQTGVRIICVLYVCLFLPVCVMHSFRPGFIFRPFLKVFRGQIDRNTCMTPMRLGILYSCACGVGNAAEVCPSCSYGVLAAVYFKIPPGFRPGFSFRPFLKVFRGQIDRNTCMTPMRLGILYSCACGVRNAAEVCPSCSYGALAAVYFKIPPGFRPGFSFRPFLKVFGV